MRPLHTVPGAEQPSAQTTYHMNAGPFEGRDPRAVAADAIGWLTLLLDDLDSIVARDSVR